MKIIQSFWSKPAFHKVQDYANARKFGGWLNFKYFLISAAYSCLTIRKHHKKIHLYTDTQGMELMSDMLELPYDDISLSLNELDGEDHRLWIRGKMHVIEQQKEPFIHIDNDIYVWEPIPTPSRFIVQSRFPMWGEYRLSLNEIFANFEYIPECLQERPCDDTMVANVGIIGGHDIDFFQRFCETSRNLLEQNRKSLPVITIGGFNQMLEEYLFTSMLRYENKDVFYLMESFKNGFPLSHLNFSLVPVVYKYIHLIGRNKQSAYACEQLELRLKHEFPEYHTRVMNILHDLNVSDSDVRQDEARRDRLLSSMKVFYDHDLGAIRKMKIRLRPGTEIIAIGDYLEASVQYAARENQEAVYTLPSFASDGISHWLTGQCGRLHKPFTIEELGAEVGGTDTLIVNAVAANLLQTGLMEFV